MGWYTNKGSGGQGLVIDEETGRNIAVTYDEKDAPIVAAAPDLLAACKAARVSMMEDEDYHKFRDVLKTLDAAISSARSS